jgi:hypothetical protein
MRIPSMLIAISIGLSSCGGTNMAFDKAKWAAEKGNYSGDNARSGMITSLDKAGIVKGTSRDKIREILGTPDGFEGNQDNWYIGRSPAGPSFEIFTIVYSSNNVMMSGEISRN